MSPEAATPPAVPGGRRSRSGHGAGSAGTVPEGARPAYGSAGRWRGPARPRRLRVGARLPARRRLRAPRGQPVGRAGSAQRVCSQAGERPESLRWSWQRARHTSGLGRAPRRVGRGARQDSAASQPPPRSASRREAGRPARRGTSPPLRNSASVSHPGFSGLPHPLSRPPGVRLPLQERGSAALPREPTIETVAANKPGGSASLHPTPHPPGLSSRRRKSVSFQRRNKPQNARPESLASRGACAPVCVRCARSVRRFRDGSGLPAARLRCPRGEVRSERGEVEVELPPGKVGANLLAGPATLWLPAGHSQRLGPSTSCDSSPL